MSGRDEALDRPTEGDGQRTGRLTGPSLAKAMTRGAYAARQLARVGWYTGQRIAAERLAKDPQSGANDTQPEPGETNPDQAVEAAAPARRKTGRRRVNLLADVRALFERDLANAEAGIYPMPRDADGGPLQVLARTRALLADMPVSGRRADAGDGQEVYRQAREEGTFANLPRYYLQNFHFQTDGYLSDRSAKLYDAQVEGLFGGTANVMRRQAIVPIADYLRGRDQRHMSLVDIACGTGRFLRMLREAFPRLQLTGVDLSEAYLREARRHLRRRFPVRLVMGNGEQVPLPDASQDLVTSVYMFHELPAKVRCVVAGEFARLLKPGGRLVFMDSLQIGDTNGYDRLLENFPGRFHEPYYMGYIREDLDALFGEAGLTPVSQTPAFLSKVSVYEKPA